MKSHRCSVRWQLVAAVLLVASPQILVAETIVYPPLLGAYFWIGSHNGNQIGSLIGNNDPITFTGGGDAGNWARNWFGRYQATGDDGCQSGCQPPVFMGLPPQDGDAINFISIVHPDVPGPYSITGGGVAFALSNVNFAINADFSGGSYDVANINILTSSVGGETSFSDTALAANQSFQATAVNDPITFQDATIDSPQITLGGGFTIESPPPAGTPLIFIKGGSQVIGGVIGVSQGFTANVSESFLRGFGMYVGTQQSDAAAEVTMTNQSDAQFTQFLLVGDEGRGKLSLEGTSKMISPNAYGVVGANGVGSLRVSDHSEVELDTLQIGLSETGDVSIDSFGKLTTNGGTLGEIAGKTGTANVESHGMWDTDQLSLGKSGIGYLYIRNDGTVKINDKAVLGENGTGFGFLNLIGENAKLEVAQGASLTIGKQGGGELSLSEGAKFTSNGAVKLGELSGSSGSVSVFGSGSVWEVADDLNVGNGDGAGTATGAVTVESGGELKVDIASAIRVGRLEHSIGTMTLRGETSKLTGATNAFYPFEIGSGGTGTMNIQEGFKLDLGSRKLTVGAEGTGNGTVKANGEGTEVTVQDLTIGERGTGLFEVTDHAKLTVAGNDIKIGKEQGSNGTLRVGDDNSQLVFEGKFGIGDQGKGTLELRGGAQITTDALTLGDSSGGEGVVSLVNDQTGVFVSDTKFETAGELILGSEGKGVLNVGANSRMSVGTNAVLAQFEGSHAEVNIQAATSTWNIDGDLTVGKAGDATVTVTKGIVNVKGQIELGELAGSHGTMFVEGSEDVQLVRPKKGLVIGKAGQAILNVHDGGKVDLSEALSFDGIVTLGEMQNSSGLAIVEGNNSQLIASALVVGQRGTGSINVNDHGEVIVLGNCDIGTDFDAVGSVEITGAGSLLNVVGNTTLGGDGNGTMTVSDHASAELDKTVSIGDPGSFGNQSAKLTVSGGATVDADPADLVIAPRGTLEITGDGSEAKFSDVNATGSAGRLATVNITSSGKMRSNNVVLRGAALTMNDGGMLECSSLQVLDQSTASLAGGAQISQASSISVGTTSGGEINLSNGAALNFLNVQGTLEIGAQGKLTMGDNASVQMSQGSIDIKGLTELSGAGSFINASGSIIGVSGTLKIKSGSNGIKASQINVSSTGKIYAASVADQIHGRVIGKVNNAGTLIVGQSPGVLVIEGDYEQTSGGALEMEIGGSTPGTQFDQLVVTGSATVAGALNLSVINSGSGFQLPTVGAQFSLLTAQGGISGEFSNAALLRSVAGGSLVHWSLDSSGTGLILKAVSITLLPAGDYNGNGVVDAADYVVWRDTLGGLNLAADGNRDGSVNELDYAVWEGNFGAGAGSGSSLFAMEPLTSNVPEPTSLVLLILAATSVFCLRRKGWTPSTKSHQLINT